jgi:hypothetical protein
VQGYDLGMPPVDSDVVKWVHVPPLQLQQCARGTAETLGSLAGG